MRFHAETEIQLGISNVAFHVKVWLKDASTFFSWDLIHCARLFNHKELIKLVEGSKKCKLKPWHGY